MSVTYALLGIVALIAAWSLYRFHRDRNYAQFDLTDLVVHNGKLDKFAFWLAVGYVFLTWAMIHLIVNDKWTEGYAGIYVGAVISPLVAKVIWGKSSNGTHPPTEGGVK